MKIHTSETLATMTPQKALQFLKEGNERFVSNLKLNRNLFKGREDRNQHPYRKKCNPMRFDRPPRVFHPTIFPYG